MGGPGGLVLWAASEEAGVVALIATVVTGGVVWRTWVMAVPVAWVVYLSEALMVKSSMEP